MRRELGTARPWLGLGSTLHAVIFAWAAHTLPWRPEAPLALVLWSLGLLHGATAVCALAGLAATPRVWRALAFASLGAAALLIGAIVVGAEQLVFQFGMLGWNLTALLAVIGVLVLGLTLPMGLWGLNATRRRPSASVVATSGVIQKSDDAPAAHTSTARLEPRRPPPSGRGWGYLVGAGTLLAVVWPLFTRRDSFPLSSYPMFSHPRGQPELLSVVATSASGTEWNVPSALVGSDEVLQTKVLIQRAVSGGQKEMARLCAGVASRVTPQSLVASERAQAPARATPERPAYVDIVSRRYDPVGYFVSGPIPIAEQRLYRCDVADPARPRAKKARRK